MVRRRRLLIFSATAASALLLLLCAGCDIVLALLGGEGLSCDSNQACANGMVCAAHRCARVAICGSNNDCPAGYFCTADSWTCVPFRQHPTDASATDASAIDHPGLPDRHDDRVQPDQLATDVASPDLRQRDGSDQDGGVPDARTDHPAHDAAGHDAATDRGGVITEDGGPQPIDGSVDGGCPGVVCDGGCIVSGRCCVSSDCLLASSMCTSHLCSGVLALTESSTYSGTTDTYISSYSANTNFGGDPDIHVRSLDDMATLIRFDVSVLPPGSAVPSGVLSLYVYGQSNPQPIQIDVYQVLRSWSANVATWNNAEGNVAWSVAGCNGAEIDRSASPASSVTISVDAGWQQFDLTAIVQGWVDDRASNHGVVLRSTHDAGGVQYNFYSSEGPASLQPKLLLTYIEP